MKPENWGLPIWQPDITPALKKNVQGQILLKKGLDETKDQSYVLSGLTQEQLQSTLLPIGAMEKSHVRQIARDNNLPTADKQDSQDLCFLAGDDYRHFIRRVAPEISTPGKMVDTTGRILGEHTGLPDYTIGQRKGLGAIQEPYYVLRKDVETNTLVIGRKEDLGSDTLFIQKMNWITGTPENLSGDVTVKIRYKAPAQPAVIDFRENGSLCVKFDKPLRDITPGQQAVLYENDTCLGGGLITRVKEE